MKLMHKLFAALPLLGALFASPSCQPAFTTSIPPGSLRVTITQNGGLGTATDRLPISFNAPQSFVVEVDALDNSGNIDTGFTGYVRFSVVPGSVVAALGDNTNGRNVEVINGKATNVTVSLVGAYGNARIWAEDLGYHPVDPAGPIPPQCSNGVDDNHNGLIDYPVDPGCYAANDDSEDGGTYAGAASSTIYFVYPRIADVRGVVNGGAGTPFPNEQVQINTEWNGSATNTPKGVVVVGLGASGFFVTDIGETRGYASLYGYTYTAPTLMYVCDRLISFGGTSADFYGFTEMNYPTWSLEEWDPTVRPCLVPEPITIDSDVISVGVGALATLEAGLVQVPQVGCSGLSLCCNSTDFAAAAAEVDCAAFTNAENAACVAAVVADCNKVAGIAQDANATNPEQTCAKSLAKYATPVSIPGKTTQATYCAGSTVHVSHNFGPTLVPHTLNSDGTCTIPAGGIGPSQTNCDYEGTGKIDFTDPCEAACSAACTPATAECSEYSGFIANQQFTLILVDNVTGLKSAIFGNGSASANFDPISLAQAGTNLGGFSGNLMYFSGGNQFTITARCADDVVTDPTALPLPSNQACVVSRTIPDTAASN